LFCQGLIASDKINLHYERSKSIIIFIYFSPPKTIANISYFQHI